jgi:hypothetical protein
VAARQTSPTPPAPLPARHDAVADGGASPGAAVARAVEVLSRHSPDVGAVAAAGLDLALGRGGCAGGSRLTRSGCPVDVAFSWPGEEVRLTVDPAPAATAAGRLARAMELTHPPSRAGAGEALAMVSTWGADRGRYGGWVGLRERVGDTSFKLYAEVATGAPWQDWERQVAGVADVFRTGRLTLCMVGLDPDRSRLELYYRAARLFRSDASTLMRWAGLPDRGDEVLAAVTALSGRSVDGEIPSADLGVSLATSEDGTPVALSVFSFAQSLLGGDGRIREAVLALAERNDWPCGAYRELSAPLTGGTGFDTCHGMVAFVVGIDGSLRVQVGLAPPAAVS